MISGPDPYAGESDSGWVTVALLGKPRGNRGEVTAVSFSKPERFETLRDIVLFRRGTDGRLSPSAKLTVESTWFHNGVLIFKFQGIDTISAAATLSGSEVRIPASERAPLDPGEFFQSDLIGCEVADRSSGDLLGHVTGWDDSGGPGLLVLNSGLLIPFARSICVHIDTAARRIEVELPAGLKELNRP
ncbi:MAG TPA: ribosome maturation factor RimM [Bryobacteraceae bacterium]|nr:ribosome maturation factor RimM [Bryobacteraceae bacterium]